MKWAASNKFVKWAQLGKQSPNTKPDILRGLMSDLPVKCMAARGEKRMVKFSLKRY